MTHCGKYMHFYRKEDGKSWCSADATSKMTEDPSKVTCATCLNKMKKGKNGLCLPCKYCGKMMTPQATERDSMHIPCRKRYLKAQADLQELGRAKL